MDPHRPDESGEGTTGPGTDPWRPGALGGWSPAALGFASMDDVSDGYHTFGELYAHRAGLMVALMISYPLRSWISLRQSDGAGSEDYFLAGMDLPTGQITYHLRRVPWWDLLTKHTRPVTVHEVAPRWDGHTSADVLDRLKQWIFSEVYP